MIAKTFLATMTLLLTMTAMACGGTDTPSTSSSGGATTTGGVGGSGGQGGVGTDATSTGNGGNGGEGGSTPDLVDIGSAACSAFETPIGPIIHDDGSPVDETGSIALLRVNPAVPVGSKFVWVGIRYILMKTGLCNAADSAAVGFTSPESDMTPPQHPTTVQVKTTLAADLSKFLVAKSTVVAMFATPIDIHPNEVAWAGVKLFGTPSKRACVISCDGGGPDPNSFFSAVNMTNTVDDCPDVICDFKLLSVSPDPQTAINYHNDNRRFLPVLIGYFVTE